MHVSNAKSMWVVNLLIISTVGSGGKEVFMLREKGVGWDPPILVANERVPGGGLTDDVEPPSHPSSDVCYLGSLYGWGP